MKAIFDRNGCSRLNGTIGAALGLITLLYCTTTFNVILPSYSYSVHGVLNLAVLSFNTLLGLYCYLACVLVDPGRVPQGWQPELEQQPTQPQLVEVKSDGTHRYCAKCQAYKPPRAHHCRRCGRCVLRMDHHCIWVNNCIGHGNYRAFLLMCFYLAAAALHALVLLFRYDLHLFSLLGKPPRGAAARLLAQHAQRSQGGGTAGAAAAAAVKKATAAAGLRTAVHRPGPVTTVRLSAAEALALVARQQPGVRGPDWPGPVWLHAMAQVCASAVALPVTLALLGLLGWNLHLLLRNQTTIEHHEGVRVQLLLQGKPPEGAGGAAPQAASKVVGEAGGRAGGMGSSGSSGSLQGLHRASKSPAGSGGSLGGSGASSVVGTSVPAAPPAPTVSSTLVTTGGGGGPGEGAGAQERRQPQSMAAAVAPPAAQPEVPPSGPPLPRRPVPVRQCKARRHPYDQGYYGNLRGVFGDWEALWCLPLRHGACGDGLAFPTRQDAC